MSHFTSLKTRFVEREPLRQALIDLGYAVEEGWVEIRGYAGNRAGVELKIATRSPGYDIGFRRAGDVYELVADWWGIKDVTQADLIARLGQRYAYHTARAKLEAQGFSLATEEQQADGRIHLILRRMA